MSFSEQVLETHVIANTQGRFSFPLQKMHTCSVQSAPFNVHATASGNAHR